MTEGILDVDDGMLTTDNDYYLGTINANGVGYPDEAIPGISIEASLVGDVYGATAKIADGDTNDPNIEWPKPDNLPDMVSPELPPEEPESLRLWRDEFARLIAHKDELEEKNRKELRLQAEIEISEWYKQHKQSVENRYNANRNGANMYESANINSENPWEKVCALCDGGVAGKTWKSTTNQHMENQQYVAGRDLSRMRNLIINLKANPPRWNK